jgi:hypothetical protein
MRDRLIHHNFDINLDVLWATVTEDLRDLLDALARSHAEMGPAEPGRYPRSDRRRLRPPALHGVVDPVMTSLELERDRVLMSLSKDGAVLSADQTPKQLQTMTTNFDLSPQDDDTLTRWMAEHIVLRAAPSHWRPLRDLELAVGAVLRPPLDQDRPTMWSPNPWRDQVATARRRLRDRAKAHVR